MSLNRKWIAYTLYVTSASRALPNLISANPLRLLTDVVIEHDSVNTSDSVAFVQLFQRQVLFKSAKVL